MPNEMDHLFDEVQKLERLVAREEMQSRRTARLSLVLTATLATMVVVFFVVNYVNFRAEFRQEKLSQSLEREMREFRPVALRQLDLLGREVLPVYGEELQRQLTQMRPEISAALQTEMDELCQQIVVSVKDEIQSVEQRVLDDVEKTLRETYPALAQDRGEAIQRRLREEGEAAVVSAVANFHDQFGQHVDDVRKSLLKFDLRDTGETRVDLQKRFIHLWLQLLDQEIMEL